MSSFGGMEGIKVERNERQSDRAENYDQNGPYLGRLEVEAAERVVVVPRLERRERVVGLVEVDLQRGEQPLARLGGDGFDERLDRPVADGAFERGLRRARLQPFQHPRSCVVLHDVPRLRLQVRAGMLVRILLWE